MTEQQASALMELMVYCSDPHRYWGSFKMTDMVGAVTALCRHRDRVFEYDLINRAIIDDVWTPELDNQIKELRTWRYI